MSNDDISTAPAARQLERDRLDEISPAQPTGADRIDADDASLGEPDAQDAPHVKHEHAHRMEH